MNKKQESINSDSNEEEDEEKEGKKEKEEGKDTEEEGEDDRSRYQVRLFHIWNFGLLAGNFDLRVVYFTLYPFPMTQPI